MLRSNNITYYNKGSCLSSMCQQKKHVVTYMFTLLLTLNLKTWALGLHIMSEWPSTFFFFFLLFLCPYMDFNNLSLFISMSNLIWINIKINDMKRHMLIYVFISMWEIREKEWGRKAWKWGRYELVLELSLKLSKDKPYKKLCKIIYILISQNFLSMKLNPIKLK